MASDRANILFRYAIIIIIILMICIAIVYSAGKTVFKDRDEWQLKADSLKIDSVEVKPTRGNIYSAEGLLMASSIPQYYLYIDFKADGLKKDTLEAYIKPLSQALSKKLGDRSPQQYEKYLRDGYHTGKRNFRIYPKRVSYTDVKEIRTFPLLKMGPNKSGFYVKQMVRRVKPFGSLASRAIGDIYGEFEMGGRNGVELSYDSLLRGTSGYSTKQKIRSRWMYIVKQEPINGADVTTTIDINMQDITEKALRDKLMEIEAESGTAVLMEVETGEVKAITNVERTQSGSYAETMNHAVADETEPGSTFKVAAMMVALDAGVVKPDDKIDTGCGIYMYANRRMTDHNWHKGGYHVISAAQSIWYSSNIGVAKAVLRGFEKRPKDFVEALYKIGLNKPMNLNIVGQGHPYIKHPERDRDLWYKTTLPWMTFGYEVKIPPIYTLTFFNAIANNGKMIKPIFVKRVSRENVTLEEMSTEVLNEQICKPQTLSMIRQMLIDVIEKGTGSPVRSKYVRIAGKTGTAQISQGVGGYKGGGHQVSFCGYFPADNPKYSCIVVIRKPRIGYPSGGGMSGVVFKNIAERVSAHNLLSFKDGYTPDTVHMRMPLIKGGSYEYLTKAMDELQLKYTPSKDKAPIAQVVYDADNNLYLRDLVVDNRLVPNVVGLGARDALFLLEQSGLRVEINGRGQVKSQSIEPGVKPRRGQTIKIFLE